MAMAPVWEKGSSIVDGLSAAKSAIARLEFDRDKAVPFSLILPSANHVNVAVL
jgi:hypothetical protein